MKITSCFLFKAWDPELALEAAFLTKCDMEMLPWQPLEYSITGIPTKAASIGK